MAESAMALHEVPTKRAVWRIVLTAVAGTVILIGLLIGAYTVYDAKANQVSELTREREALQETAASLSSDLRTTRIKLRRQNGKLTGALRNLNRAKRNLTAMRKEVVAANERAAVNYTAGYSAGNTEGYSSGRTDGLVAGSDDLVCSDDPDVTWLPACDW